MKKNNKGFTLAELLIVVAIIAVLVAIAIPVFNAQLEKSRDSVTASNIRAAYAEAASKLLLNEDVTTSKSKQIVTISDVAIKGQLSNGYFSASDLDLPFTLDADTKVAATLDKKTSTVSKYKATFTWSIVGGEVQDKPTLTLSAS